MKKCRFSNCKVILDWKNLELCDSCILKSSCCEKYNNLYDMQKGCCYYCGDWRPKENPDLLSLRQQVSVALLPDWCILKRDINQSEFIRLSCYYCLRTKRLFRTMANIGSAISYLYENKTMDCYDGYPIHKDIYREIDLMREKKRMCSDCANIFSVHHKKPSSYCKDCQKKHRIDLKDVRKNRHSIIREHGQECEICNLFIYKQSRLHLDHDHQTGFYRGLLCSSCNAGLGYARDSTTVLQKILERS